MVKIKSIFNKNGEYYKAFIDINDKTYTVIIMKITVGEASTYHCIVFDSNMDIVFESDTQNASEKVMLSCIYSCANQLVGVKYNSIESSMNDALTSPVETKEQAFGKFSNILDKL